jgi:NAD-dependent deacetylase
MPPNYDATLLASLRRAQHVLVLTGAGVSAESGIPTFRDRLTGLWVNYDAMQLATPEAFASDPSLVWGWYEWRGERVRAAAPNPAHLAIARLAACVPRLTLVTQNVDDLHERAGSRGVIHLHGELARPYCERCRAPHAAARSDAGHVGASTLEGGARSDPPRCAQCGGRVRPGVVWFGEALPRAPWEAAVAAARGCDLFFCVGTSAVVQPAASLIDLAQRAGATSVQVNPDPTGADRSCTHLLHGPAGELLPPLVAAAFGAENMRNSPP